MKPIHSAIVFVGLLAGCAESRYLPPMRGALHSTQLRGIVTSAALRYTVPSGLVRAVLMAESAGNVRALSSAGAQGLMQLMPATAQSCGIRDPFDPFENVDCGTRYLHGLLQRYHNNVRLAVAAYNAGPGAVTKYGGVPPYLETRTYVTRVLASYQHQP